MSLASSPSSDSKNIIELKLDDAGDHVRKFVQFPNGQMLVYGGDDGTINQIIQDKSQDKPKIVTARQYDEAGVRAMCVSNDGKRVAVGFGDGATKIYCYDDYDIMSNSDDNHPFIPKNNNSSNEDDLGMGLSQDFGGDDEDDDSRVWAGPQYEVPIRDMSFHPLSSSSAGYWLAVASEKGMCLMNVTSNEFSERHLEDLVEKEHDECGIRALQFIESSAKTTTQLVSLAMDGRLCVWNVPISAPATSQLHYRFPHRNLIASNDIGEMLGSEVYDRAMRPFFMHGNNEDAFLVLPGQLQVQFYNLNHLSNHPSTTTDSDKDDDDDQKHIEPIAHILSSSTNQDYFITAGKDSRVILWKITYPSSSNNSANNTTTVPLPKVRFVKHLALLKSLPTHMEWVSASKNGDDEHAQLYVACANGTLQMVSVPIPLRASKTTTSTPSTAETAKAARPAPPAPLTTMHVHNRKDDNENATDKTDDASTNAKDKPRLQKKKSVSFSDEKAKDDDDDSDVEFTQTSSKPKNAFIDDEAEDNHDDNEDDNVVDTTATNDENKTTNNDSLDVEQEDIRNAAMTQATDDALNDDIMASLDNDDNPFPPRQTPPPPQTIQLPQPQPPFAPSSTPLDLPRRFLCWNHIGSITLQQDSNDDSMNHNHNGIVDIHFNNSAFRRSVSFTDNMGFILGSVGDEGAIFATDLLSNDDDDDDDDNDISNGAAGSSSFLKRLESKKQAIIQKNNERHNRNRSGSDKPKGSSLYFHRFETFASLRDKDWYLTLPDGERIVGCACGEGWAAAITSRKFLRFYTSGGNQGPVTWLNGEPVTMVGRSRYCAVFYHEANPFYEQKHIGEDEEDLDNDDDDDFATRRNTSRRMEATQKLGYMLLDAQSQKLLSTGSVSCLSSGASLSWAGFTNDHSLMVMDTDGMLSMLVLSLESATNTTSNTALNAGMWVPILDTIGLRKSMNDDFWPVHVHDAKLVCVPLRGGNEYPEATARRPVTTVLNLRMPLAKSTIHKSAMEELSVRSNLALTQKKIMHDYLNGEEEDEEYEKEYRKMCTQVDKLTLKLFAATVEAGKLERALDLVDRLHLEKSYDLAIAIADNHRKLADLIEEAKENKFMREDENEEGDEDASFDDNNKNTTFDDFETHGQNSDDDDRNVNTKNNSQFAIQRRVSPDSNMSKRTYDKVQQFGNRRQPNQPIHQRQVKMRKF